MFSIYEHKTKLRKKNDSVIKRKKNQSAEQKTIWLTGSEHLNSATKKATLMNKTTK